MYTICLWKLSLTFGYDNENLETGWKIHGDFLFGRGNRALKIGL